MSNGMRSAHLLISTACALLSGALAIGCLAPREDEAVGADVAAVLPADPCVEQTPTAITANGDDGHVPSNVADGDLATRWSQLGKGAWIQFDLGAVKSICRTQVAWYKGDQRKSHYSISVSSDDETFSLLHSGDSSGATTALETQELTAKTGRYVRVTADGNTVNDWASVTELKLFATTAPVLSDPAPAKPDASNTGPRIKPSRTLSAAAALTELRTAKKLSGVLVTGSFRLSGADGRGWVIEDCRFEARGATYAVQSYASLSPFTGSPAERPIMKHVQIVGSAATGSGNSSSSVYGSDLVLDHADIFGSSDGIKPTGRMDVLASWIHDNDHPSGAHCDAIQIRSGKGILIRGSRLDAYIGYSSDGSAPLGGRCSGGLQTGNLGPIEARWEDNWFAGGHYTIRGSSSSDLTYVFRNNKWMRSGTSVALNRNDLAPHTYGPTTGTLGDFDATNVWEDTGRPVR